MYSYPQPISSCHFDAASILLGHTPLLLAYHLFLGTCKKHAQGCALDFFTTRSLTENDEARVSMGEYMSRRNGTCRHQSGKSENSSVTTSSSPASPPRSARREDSAGVTTANTPPNNVDSPTPPWTEKHVSVVRDAIFGTLAGFARDALKEEPSAAKTHAAGADERLLLFNEQFVVKPPQSSIEFGWHTVRDGNGGVVKSVAFGDVVL